MSWVFLWLLVKCKRDKKEGTVTKRNQNLMFFSLFEWEWVVTITLEQSGYFEAQNWFLISQVTDARFCLRIDYTQILYPHLT